MVSTCVITGYKVTVSSIIVYGFIISNNLVTPPPLQPPNVTTTPHTPVTTTPDLVSVKTSPTPTPTVTTSTSTSRAPKTLLPNYSQCGKPPSMSQERAVAVARVSNILNSLLLSRILGGKTTAPGEWPWVAYLYEKHNGKKDGFFCGGALVGDQWVITAAHCIAQAFSPEVYGVVLGKFYSGTESEHEVSYDVIDIVIHPKYSLTTFNNDLCMLKLDKPVVYTRYIQRLCILPQGFPSDNTTGKTFAGRICTTVGWGEQSPHLETKDVADKLQQLNVVILPHILCTSTTTTPTSLPYQGRGVLQEDPKLCAGGVKGEDTCDGDSGGPLICLNDDGRHYLHAITSYGTNPCGQKNLPGVYTRMADFHDWMREIIEGT